MREDNEGVWIQNGSGWIQTWQNSRWLPSSSSVRMHEWSFFVQNGWIQDGRIQDGCHHQVEWEWISLRQIKLIWVRLRVEWECFWVNLREENKVSESKMAVSESKMAEFKMAAIIKLSQNQWMTGFFLVPMVGREVKMWRFLWWKWWEPILCKCEWVSEEKLRCLKPGWQNWRWQNCKMAAIYQVEVTINEFESDWISFSQSHNWNESIFEWIREKITRCLNPRWQWSESTHGRLQDGCHQENKSESMSEVFFVQMVRTNLGKCEWVWEEILKWLNPRWPNSRWQNLRWLPSSRWVRMNEFDWNWVSLSQSFVQNGWIQDGRIQDGCHHQIESE